MQRLLDEKAANGSSLSVVSHLRWDLKQIFDLAVSKRILATNPAIMLFVPKNAREYEKKVMSREEVIKCFEVLPIRERLIVKFAVIRGMRPGEILALTWSRLTGDSAQIDRRIYRGEIDTPKTRKSRRLAAISDGIAEEVRLWRALSPATEAENWVFPSENMRTPLSRDNVWRRHIQPYFDQVGLGWVTFQVMRRTHSTLANQRKTQPKVVADQMGHSVDVNQNVYTQTPLPVLRAALNDFEQSLHVGAA